MYPHPYRHPQPQRKGSYFFPFVSLIMLGLIVVLVFQIVEYFQEKQRRALENKAAVHIVAGRAEIKIWGVDQWTHAFEGSVLSEGDEIRTAPGSRAILSLLNGSLIRVSSESHVELLGLKTRDNEDEVSIGLSKGEAWVKRSPEATVRSNFTVMTPNLTVNSLGTVFNVSAGDRQVVRVLHGKVKVLVNVPDPDAGENAVRTAETLEIALGQEINIGPSEIADLQNRKPLELLALLADDFRNSDWYVWNRNEDLTGGSGITLQQAVLLQQQEKEREQAAPLEKVAQETIPEVRQGLAAPLIVSPPESERITKSGVISVTGTTDAETQKIEVTTYISSTPESYTLQKYKPSSLRWNAVLSREYGNLIPGSNRVTFTAIGKEGQRSEPAELTIVYDKPKEPADLSPPRILKLNGQEVSDGKFETEEDAVLVEGSIGKGIQKVYVNDFLLTRYVPDSLRWSYFAKPVYGNLKEGENAYSVYGIDLDSHKTPAATFTIVKKPKPVPEPAEAPVGAAEPVL